MAQQTRTTMKGVFEQGDTPQGSDYVNLVDSYLSLADTTAQTVTSDLTVPILTATETSANRGNFGTVNVSGSSTFTGPVYASATAQFTGMVLVSGTAFFHKPIHVSPTAHIQGPFRVGAAGNISVMLAQAATIVAINSAGNPVTFSIPSGADVKNIWIDMEAPFASGVVTANRVTTYIGGTGVSAASLISEIAVSASGQYNLLRTTTVAGNHTLLRNVTTTVHAFQSMKATDSAATAGQGILTVHYIQRA